MLVTRAGRRIGRRLSHLGRIARDLVGYAVANRVVWLIPLVVLIGVLVVLAAMGQAVAPFTLYPLF